MLVISQTMAKTKIKQGDTFGRLTVNRLLGHFKAAGNRGVYPLFECSCSCGNIKNVFSCNLVRKNTKSCGCLKKEAMQKGQRKIKDLNSAKRLIPFHPENYLLSYYRINAERRNLHFQIGSETFSKFIHLPCSYCGREKASVVRRHGVEFKYNGLDRVDNKVGYFEGNLRTCCKFCNRMKGIFSKDFFLENVKSIWSHSFGCNRFSSLDALLEWRKGLKAQNKKLVLATGCFDVFHNGHSTYLQNARTHGDVLLVGLNNDKSVKAFKGDSRPINNERDRADVIASLRSVDAVYVYDDTAKLLEDIHPDVWIKGSDYTLKSLNQQEVAAVKRGGGEIVFSPLVAGLSSSILISSLKNLNQSDSAT